MTDTKGECIELINKVEAEQADALRRDKSLAQRLEGRWELIWTTEKETLFFAKSGLFGSPCTTISQTIDLTKGGVIKNLIEFKDDKVFSVLGNCSTDKEDPRVCNFSFKSAKIIAPPFVNLSLPPVGKGSFVNVFCNELYRVSKDSRGDYLVTKRVA